MKAYKATYNQICRNVIYEVGKTYTHNGPIELCQFGFHFCLNPKNTLNYYPYNRNFVLLEIEVLGKQLSDGHKSVTNKFKVTRIVPDKEHNKLIGCSKKHDKNGNLIYLKDFNNEDFWEYDKNNNCIYHKDIDGDETFWEYNENNKLTCEKRPNGIEYHYNEHGYVIKVNSDELDSSEDEGDSDESL